MCKTGPACKPAIFPSQCPHLEQALGDFEVGSFCLAGHLRVAGFGHALGECVDGCASIQTAPLMRPLGVVALKVFIEHRLHLVDGLKPGAPPLDPEMLIKRNRCLRPTGFFAVTVVCGWRAPRMYPFRRRVLCFDG